MNPRRVSIAKRQLPAAQALSIGQPLSLGALPFRHLLAEGGVVDLAFDFDFVFDFALEVSS